MILSVLTSFLFCLLQTVWINADTIPVFGKCSDETSSRYSRIPASFEKVSRHDIWYIGRASAGLYLRFRTDSKNISAKWTSTFKEAMNHQALCGTRGLDLYALEKDGWHYVGTARPDPTGKSSTADFIRCMDGKEREYMMHLSLYDGIDSLFIGIDEGSSFREPQTESPVRSKPIVFYGTSVDQGGCASRPGKCISSIMARKMNREVINMGFSGNAKLDLEVAEYIAAVKDPGAYILDYGANSSYEDMLARDRKFYDIIRNAHPDVPIIIINIRKHPTANYNVVTAEEVSRKEARISEFFSSLKKGGDRNVYLIPSSLITCANDDITVDGIHPSDDGMVFTADVISKYMNRKIKFK